VQLEASIFCTCGLAVDQTVHCWGCLTEPENGVDGPIGLFTQITAHPGFHCGVRVDGSIHCWGAVMFAFPVNYPEKFVQVSCAQNHCCAIKEDGKFLLSFRALFDH
jgi:hypothetical protein